MNGELEFLRKLAERADQAPFPAVDVVSRVTSRLRRPARVGVNRPLVGVALGASLAACLLIALEWSRSVSEGVEESPAISALAASELMGPDLVMEAYGQ